MQRTAIRIPRAIWLLGLVSLFMDLSSEIIHGLLPVFLVSVLGASTLTLGLIEGVAEGTASFAKVFSGVLSDRFGRRKPLVVLGYGLAALAKPLFPIATTAAWVFTARFVDRIGKGIRGAPRDAMIADLAPPAARGAAYGLRQSLDTAGALLGPLAAIGLMGMFGGEVRTVFWIAVLPALVAVAILVLGVDEPERHVEGQSPRMLPHWSDLRQLGVAVWIVVVLGAVFGLARFSEAFLVLRAHDAGLSFAWTPLALVVMNLTYVGSVYPFGKLSDGVDRGWMLAGGLAVLIAADLVLAFGQGIAVVLVGVALWGLHMGLTQGLLAAMVADAAPPALRGSAFGVFHLISGLAAIAGSLLAGALWKWGGPSQTFFAGAVLAALALCGLLWWRMRSA